MDGLSATANIIVVLDLTAKIATLLFKFSKEVKAAKSDIENLQGELNRLSIILEGGRGLLEILWNMNTTKGITQLNHEGNVRRLTYSHDGNLIASVIDWKAVTRSFSGM